jgi:excisionase family DNA binding protein
MNLDTAPDPMTTAEVAQVMRLGKTTVCELCSAGLLRHLRLGRKILIYKDDLKNWIEANKR